MLPSFNLQSKNLTDEKKFALIANYLNQLKDESEREIYSIDWGNLTKNLQNRLLELDKVANDSGEYAQMVAQNLEANYISAQQIDAKYVATQNLDAAVANVGYIKADYINTERIQAVFAKSKNFSGERAYFDDLSSDYFSTSVIEILCEWDPGKYAFEEFYPRIFEDTDGTWKYMLVADWHTHPYGDSLTMSNAPEISSNNLLGETNDQINRSNLISRESKGIRLEQSNLLGEQENDTEGTADDGGEERL